MYISKSKFTNWTSCPMCFPVGLQIQWENTKAEVAYKIYEKDKSGKKTHIAFGQ